MTNRHSGKNAVGGKADVGQSLHTHPADREMRKENPRQPREGSEAFRAKYSGFYNFAPVGYFTISSQGVILEVNLRSANMLDMGRDLLLDRRFTQFIALDDQDTYNLFHKKVFETGKPQTCELRMARPDGTQLWVRLDAAVSETTDTGTRVCFTVMSDITERVKAQAELRLHNAMFNSMVEGVNLIRVSDGIIVYSNRKIEEMFGYAKGELLGKHISIVNAPGDQSPEQVAEEIIQALTVKGEWNGEVKNIKKNGAVFWTDAHVSTFRHPEYGDVWVSVHSDITERKNAESALREAVAKAGSFSDAMDNIPSYIYMKDLNHRYFYANKPTLALFKCSAEELAGSGDEKFFPPETVARLKAVDDRVLERGESTMEEIDVSPDSPERRVYWELKHPIYDGAGKICGLCGISTDITSRKTAEEALKESEHLLKTVLEIMPVGVWMLNTKGELISGNQAARRIWAGKHLVGIDRFGEYRGWWLESGKPIGAHEWAGARAVEKGETSHEEEILIQCFDGTKKIILDSAVPIRTAGGRITGAVTINQDISERKQAEEALQKSETRFRQTLDNMLEGCMILGFDWTYLYLNETAAHHGQNTRENLIGRTLTGMYPGVEKSAVFAHYQRCMKERIPQHFEESFTFANGITTWYEFSVEPIQEGIFVLSLDITERKQAEDTLREAKEKADALLGSARESDEKVKLLLNSIGEAVYGIDLEGNCTFHNKACLKILGYEDGNQLLGRNMHDLIHHSRNDSTPYPVKECKIFKAFREGIGTHVDDEVLWRADGTSFAAEYRSFPIWRDGKAIGSVVSFTDITERKKAEEALQSINWLLKEDSGGSDALLKGQEYQPDYGDLTALNRDGEILNSVDKDTLYNIVTTYLDLLGTSSAIYEKNGDYAIGLFSSSWCRFMDSASRKQCGTDDNRNALAEGKWLCHESCWSDASKVSIREAKPVDIECHGGIRLYAVPILAGGESIGSINFGYGNPPTDPKELGKIAERYSVDIEEITRLAKEYKPRPPFLIELAKKRLRDSATLIGVLIERKAVEEKLKEAKEAAEEATRLKDKFVSLVAHDLKSPLSSMTGFLKLVRGDEAKPLDEGAKLILDRAIDSGKQLSLLIDDLLNMNRLKAGTLKLDKQFFDAKYLGAKMCADFSYSAENKEIKLTNRIPDNSRIFADRTLLAEALQNLVTNAIKFCRKGDSITISLSDTGKTNIQVRDTGPGMKPEMLNRLFKYDTKMTTMGTAGEPGTGFGLPLAKDIMLLHGGDLEAASEMGKGCTFTLKIPYVRPRILIVDDDPSFRFLLTQYLKGLGADILEAEDGESAAEVIAQGADLPHLIISDIEMPKMTGLELLSHLQKRHDTQSIPVIIISGKHGMEVRDTVYGLGGKDFLTKQLDLDDFIPRVRRFIS